MIIKWLEPRQKVEMFTDNRLLNQVGRFCLCTRCKKTTIYDGETAVCKRHDDFIKEMYRLEVTAPIFGCPEFNEREDQEDLLLIGLKRNLTRSSTKEIKWAVEMMSQYLWWRECEDKSDTPES